jgi:hypothetical protein
VSALGERDGCVDRVANDGVREEVVVDPLGILHEQPCREPFFERVESLIVRHSAEVGEDFDRQVSPNSRGRAEDRAGAVGESIEAAIGQCSDTGRSHCGERPRDVGRIVELDGLFVELGQELVQEQRVSARDILQRRGKVDEGVHRLGRRGRAHECSDLVIVESCELHLRTTGGRRQVFDELASRTVDLVVAVGRDDEGFVERRVSQDVTE